MAVWKIEFFDNKGDVAPSLTTWIEADSEEVATQLAVSNMGFATRVDLEPVKIRMIPAGTIIHVISSRS
jgi:hypothetical protein